MASEIDVRDEPDESRYALYVDGELTGIAEYALAGDTIAFTHTVISHPDRGSGLGGRLVEAAVADVRERGGLTVDPQCPFVAHWFEEHPDQADLLG